MRTPTIRRPRAPLRSALALAAALAASLAAPAAALACSSSAPPPANADPGTTIVADGFEGGTLSNWTLTRQGDATATVQGATVKSDACAALLTVTANAGSRASLTKALPSTSHEVWATGWFDVVRQGASTASNVPTFRFFNGSSRLLDVSRQNGNGALFVRWPSGSGWSWNATGRTLTVGRWYQVKIHAVANAAQSQVWVWLDGTKVFERSSAATGWASFGSFRTVTQCMVGAEHTQQDGDFAADDLVVKTL